MNTQNERKSNNYRKKYKFLKIRIKSLILENAALCDEVARIQESINIVKDERRFLLYKLLEYENDTENLPHFKIKNEPVTSNGAKVKTNKKRNSVDDTR